MNILEELGASRVSFKRRPSPVPGDKRLVWRAYLVLLFLDRLSRAKTSSLMKLHVLNWAFRSYENQSEFLAALEQDFSGALIVHFDPGLPRVLAYLTASGLVERNSAHRYKLTDAGEKFVETLKGTQALEQIRKTMDSLTPNRVTEEKLGALLNRK